MRHAVPALLLALSLPAAAHAQAADGWELRANLQTVSASVCDIGGSCFGVVCTAAGGWSPSWFADVRPQGEGEVPDPILAIRAGGERFAITTLTSAPGAPDGAQRYAGPLGQRDEGLLETLQAGETMEVDPGRDFALATFSLRGSRWAVTSAIDLCAEGGPDAFEPEPEAETASE